MNQIKERTEWLERAMECPLRFAQVREDPRLDLQLAESLEKPVDILMVCSGGCSLASLVASNLANSIIVTDMNPAQIALGKLKLALLSEPLELRLKLLGHQYQSPVERISWIEQWLRDEALPLNIFGDSRIWGALGLDHCGRYELLFAELRKQTKGDPWTLESPGRSVPFSSVMSRDNLVALFGQDATANPRVDFWKHFQAQTEKALAKDKNLDNPFLQQMLCGQFSSIKYDWLEKTGPRRWPEVRWRTTTMLSALQDQKDNSIDFVHLSNILDWLQPSMARGVLLETARVLRPGGLVIVRQLNSSLEIRSLSEQIVWKEKLSNELLAEDRSFFYREIHVGLLP